MKKRLLLDWIALQARDVAERYTQLAVLDEAHLADAALAFADQAAMAASDTADAVVFRVAEGADAGAFVKDFGQRRVNEGELHCMYFIARVAEVQFHKPHGKSAFAGVLSPRRPGGHRFACPLDPLAGFERPAKWVPPAFGP